MQDPLPPSTPAPIAGSAQQPWSFGRIAFLAFRVLWTLVLAQAAGGLMALEAGVPVPLGFALALPVAWWLSGMFRAWGRRPDPAAQSPFARAVHTAAEVWGRAVCSLIVTMIVPEVLIQAGKIPPGLEWVGWLVGLGVGIGWFLFARRFAGRSDAGAFEVTLPACSALCLWNRRRMHPRRPGMTGRLG